MKGERGQAPGLTPEARIKAIHPWLIFFALELCHQGNRLLPFLSGTFHMWADAFCVIPFAQLSVLQHRKGLARTDFPVVPPKADWSTACKETIAGEDREKRLTGLCWQKCLPADFRKPDT